MNDPVFELVGSVQNYDWGKIGSQSVVAQLAQKEVVEGKPYAELWMGTHPNGPAVIRSTGQPLTAWLTAHPAALGEAVRAAWPGESGSGQLPYLFKVLSIAKALSIQAHPDRALAAQLASRRPDLYKDANHKPELALAVSTEFEALCQFRPLPDILHSLQLAPELRRLVGDAIVSQVEATVARAADEPARKAALRALFTALMTAPEERVRHELAALIERLKAERQQQALDQREELALRVHEQFPGDVGVLSVYLLNYVRLPRGAAIFLAANEPHAYLSGECAEVMAASDNVVRAGLTPKFKDVETLTSMLTYRDALPTALDGTAADSVRRVYAAPIDDFLLEVFTVSPAAAPYQVPARRSASIMLCFEGRGSVNWQRPQQQQQNESSGGGDISIELQRGTVVFVAAQTAVELRVGSAGQPLLVFSCSANL